MPINKREASIEALRKALDRLEGLQFQYVTEAGDALVQLGEDDWDFVIKSACSSTETVYKLLGNTSAQSLHKAMHTLIKEKTDLQAEIRSLLDTEKTLAEENVELVNRINARESELKDLSARSQESDRDLRSRQNKISDRLHTAIDMMRSMLRSKAPNATHGARVEDFIIDLKEEGLL